jgi:tetratricopeptide (TPR) repeat protein
MMLNLKRLFVIFLLSLILSLLVAGKQLVAKPFQLQQAQQYLAQGQYQSAIAILESFLKTSNEQDKLKVYYPLARAYAAAGKVESAISVLEKGILAYRQSENSSKLARLLIEQSQAYTSLGQNQKAISLLTEAIELSKPNPQLHLLALGSQGNIYLQQGDLDKAIELYRASLKSSQKRSLFVLTILNNLTSAYLELSQKYQRNAEFALQEKEVKESERLTFLASQNYLEASKSAISAIEASQNINNLSTVKAYINAIEFNPQAFSLYRQNAVKILQHQPDSRAKVFWLINLAKIDKARQIEFLKSAIQSASAIEDNRALSYAFGALGEAYERLKDYKQSFQYAERAIESSKQALAYDSLYRWWWLLGRIYRQTGSESEAIASYRLAIASLQKIRSNIASASNEDRLSFRDEIEPVYREFVEMLLEQEQSLLWQEALDTFDLLQLAELESFFGDICTPIEQPLKPSKLLAQTQSLAISIVILPQKTFLVVLRPDGKVHRYPIAISALQLTNQVRVWRDALEDKFNYEYFEQSQALYNLLVRPIERDLKEIKPKTLVFIGDRNLKNVPMAALYDGKQYLIEKYSVVSL